MTGQQQQLPNPQDFHLIALDVPVPPMLEEALGYHGTILKHECNARFVAFYWANDDFMMDDGSLSGTASGWYAFRIYTEHRATMDKFAPYNFLGDQFNGGLSHFLVLDREARKIHAGTSSNAGNFLISQWSRPDVDPFDRDTVAAADAPTWDALLQDINDLTTWQEVNVDQKAIAAAMHRQDQLQQDLYSWLNEWAAGQQKSE